MVSREGPVLSTAERSRLIRRVVDEAVGLGVLEPLLADDSVTEIMVNGTDEIYVERDGRIERADIAFSDEAQLYQTIDRIVSTGQPARGRVQPDGRRPPAHRRARQRDHPAAGAARPDDDDPPLPAAVHDRRAGQHRLARRGRRPTCCAAFVRAKLNIVISGGTGAGKTTLLNALSAAVPDGERIITVEDNAELRLQQPHVVTLEARPANVEGKGEVTIRDLVRNSLRMRPDRIIVGEVRGAETIDMLQALNTGHEGSLVTLHSNSCDDAIHRLGTLASMSELQIPFEALRDQINSAIDVIVQVDRFADGRRRVDRGRRRRLAPARDVPARLGDGVRGRSDRPRPPRHAACSATAGCPEAVLRRLMLHRRRGARRSSPASPSDEVAVVRSAGE